MTIAQNQTAVKPASTAPPNGVIHHNGSMIRSQIVCKFNKSMVVNPYGVSQSRRVISPSALIKRHEQVRSCLRSVLRLSVSEREVVFRLLRLWCYYGSVYPKESQITADPGCSKATFWRTIKLLRELGLVVVINRYVRREKAQISNLYRLDKLILLLARYLAEHGARFSEKWIRPFMEWDGCRFWREFWRLRLDLRSDCLSLVGRGSQSYE